MLLDCPTKRVNLSPLEEQSSSKHTNTVMMQTAPPPPPQVAMAPEKLAHYDVPGKHLAFEQKPFTDRLQAMEESRLAALHYSTGLTRNIKLDDEHLGILGAAPTTPPQQPKRNFRLGRWKSSDTRSANIPAPPPADEQRKPNRRKLPFRRKKELPPHEHGDESLQVEMPAAAVVHQTVDEEELIAEAPTPPPAPLSPRSAVRDYLETLGHSSEATEAVVLAFTEAEYPAEEWLPELQDMQEGSTLLNFLELCSTALPDLHAKATSVQAFWRGFHARSADTQCRAAATAVQARAAYAGVVSGYRLTTKVAPTVVALTEDENDEDILMPAELELDMDDYSESTDSERSLLDDAQVVRLSFAFVTSAEKLELVLSPSTPGHAARVSREIIEDRRRSSMIAHSIVCESGLARDHVGMGRNEMVTFASDVVKMATSKLSTGSGPIWVNPTWENGAPERTDDC